MKKLFVLAVCSFLLLSCPVAAQDDLLARNDKMPPGVGAATMDKYVSKSMKVVAVDDRVKERFSKDFAGINDAEWTSAGKDFVVRFSAGGMQYWAFRSKKGHCQGWLRHYNESDLPAAVRTMVRRAYYDYSILGVSEVFQSDKTVYFVTIGDATSYKVVRVSQGELEVYQEFSKG